jgi:hypothetical protein
MQQVQPGHPGDGSFAQVSDRAMSSFVRSILPPLSPFLLNHITAKDLARKNSFALPNKGGHQSIDDEKKPPS